MLMRLILGLSALVVVAADETTSTPSPAPTPVTTWPQFYPLCDSAGTQQFIDALSVASNGCTDKSSYDWGGPIDPDLNERMEICQCNVTSFTAPKCMWNKMTYKVSTIEHFNYVYQNCRKPKPVVEQEDAHNGTVAPSPSNRCSPEQTTAFDTALFTASKCLGSTSYNWTQKANPTTAQLSEICKCPTARNLTIPECSVWKDSEKLTLSDHYNWVFNNQCTLLAATTDDKTVSSNVTVLPNPNNSSTSTSSKKSSSNIGLIAGIGGAVVVIALLIGIFLWRRKRNSKDREAASHKGNDVPSPMSYHPMVETRKLAARPSAASTVGNTNSNSNVTMRQSSTMGRETGNWDDPEIVSVRIPYDAISFGILLSRGGFGEVYKGTYGGETVAIKRLLPDRRKDLAQIDEFLGEVKLSSMFEHDRIVRFIGVAWKSLRDACMVVEFMDNGDLRSMLSRWDAGPAQRTTGFDADKVKIALHVVHALVYLHSLQPIVVHRDLKSKNVLLDSNLDAKLTDFGHSRERADVTMTAGVGSSFWMAPEVMMGKRYDEKADIFSFGVVLSELDTHQLPYFHAKFSNSGQKLPEAAILQQVMLGNVTVAFSATADRDLVQLGHECVSLEPKDRPTSAQVLHRVHQAMRQYR